GGRNGAGPKSPCVLAERWRWGDKNRHITNFVGRSPSIASSTLSRTVSLGNRLVTWKVRAMPNAVRRWLGHFVTSWPNSMTCPELAGRIPVIKLNSVVLPAPFGPLMAFRWPGMTVSVTPRTAASPPQLLERPRSSRAGQPPSAFTSFPSRIPRKAAGAPRAGPGRQALIAVFAGREVAAVDRRLEELVLVELPELGDVRIGLDDGIPELLLVVAEHLLLLDLLDVDVLHGIAHVVDADRTADGIQFQRGQLFDELLGAGEVALIVLDDLLDHLRRRVVGLRVIRRHLAELGAIFLHERLVLRRFQRGAVLQRGDVADHLVAHGRQHELVVARPAAEHRLLVAGGGELLGELQRHGADHEGEDRVGVLPDGRDVGAEILGA